MHLPNGSDSGVAIDSTPLQAERCQCCPFGYHLDLDFVNFAQDVAAGRKNPEPTYGSRRQTPVTFADSKRSKPQINGPTHREQTPPSAFKSISKRSLNDIVKDLNEITEFAEVADSVTSPTSPRSTNENVGFSTLPAKINSKDWASLENGHQNGTYNSNYSSIRQTPLSPIIDSSPMDSGNWGDLRDTSKTPLTVSANQEVQQILEHQPRSTSIRRLVTSAPTSPIPRTYYTAIGQSLAQLKDRTPVSQISSADHSYTTTTTIPRRSAFNSTPSSTPVNYSPSAAAKPPLPRRYFEGGRQTRVLSPDPKTSTASPNLLRSSNLQSRTYFKPTSSLNAAQPSQSKTIAYRSRLSNGTPIINGTSTGSPLFDSFASVKRSMGMNMANENRSLSPTNYVSSPLAHAYTSTPTSHLLQSTQTQTPPVQIVSNKNYRDSPTQTKQQLHNNNESQTQKVSSKTVAVSTINAEQKSVGTLVLPNQSTVSLDTSDLVEPPVKEPQLSFEFQYCIGHESEHLYEELAEIQTKQKHSKSTYTTLQTSHASTLCKPLSMNSRTQTESTRTMDNETQTSNEWLMKEVKALMAVEKAERKSVDKKVETDESDSEFILVTCSRCQHPIEKEHYEKIIVDEPTQSNFSQASSPQTVTIKSSSSSSDQDEGLGLIEPLDFDLTEHQDKSEQLSPPQLKTPSPRSASIYAEDSKSLKSEKSIDDEEREMLANLDQLAHLDPDRFSLASVQTVICVQPPQPEEQQPQPRPLDPSRAEAIRKLLTETQPSSFQRESSTNRSYRVDKKALDLDYILEKHSQTAREKSPTSSTPSDDPEKPLKEMVVLKKFVSLPSNFPDPVPARIPRPKFSKFSQVVEQAETPDEAAEAIDKLTPLRSELQSLDAWRNGPNYRRFRHHQFPNYSLSHTESTLYAGAQSPPNEDYTDEEDEIQAHGGDVSTSNSSITSLEEDASSNDEEAPVEFEMTAPLKEALETLNKHLQENNEIVHSTDWETKYVQNSWLQISTRKSASAKAIQSFIDALRALSEKILKLVVNFVDQNGNSALHYAVSHENYKVISSLLDTPVKLDVTNKAGYSPVMLAALCTIKDETESAIIQRLFERGNVNAKAIYHGQTALMLSVSHARIETTQLLLKLGADLNIQDIDGSTALMCAAEHGHIELVKLLLQQPTINASLHDCDNQTALSIAVENGHRDIGVLIYGFLNHSRAKQHETNSL